MQQVRATANPTKGTLLAVQLGAAAGLPYGKLAHVAYRHAALVHNPIEQSGCGAKSLPRGPEGPCAPLKRQQRP